MSDFKIGIPGWKIGDNSFGITTAYLEFIRYFGTPVILHPDTDIIEDLDLVILPGGPDVNPENYGATPSSYTGRPCLFKEHFDKHYLPTYIALGTPIYGICRGMQALAVHFGGKMIQHINHETNEQYNRNKLVHGVAIENEYRNILLRNGINRGMNYKTNSMHHQAVMGMSLRDTDMAVIGKADDRKSNRIIELIAHKTLPIVGEQAHPEETFNDFAVDTINFLLEHKRSILTVK